MSGWIPGKPLDTIFKSPAQLLQKSEDSFSTMFTLKNALMAMFASAGVVTALPVDDPVSVTIRAPDVSVISERSGCSQGACPDKRQLRLHDSVLAG